MKNKFLKSISVILLVLSFMAIATPVSATSFVLQGVKCAGEGTPIDVKGQEGTPYDVAPLCGLCDFVLIFVNVSNMIVAFSGALAVLIFVYAGVMYLTVSFNPANLDKAKNSIKAVIIGLAFIFAGYTIINFVILTFVGGTDKMAGPFRDITGRASWGVCAGYGSTDVQQ